MVSSEKNMIDDRHITLEGMSLTKTPSPPFLMDFVYGLECRREICGISECRQSYLSDYPCQNQKVTFQVWNWESNESLYSSKNDRITLFLELYEKNSPESSKKCARWCFFGTMREKNVLSVPKSLRIAFFWNYEGKNVLSVPKNLQIAIFWDYASNTCPDSSKANNMGGTLSTV